MQESHRERERERQLGWPNAVWFTDEWKRNKCRRRLFQKEEKTCEARLSFVSLPVVQWVLGERERETRSANKWVRLSLLNRSHCNTHSKQKDANFSFLLIARFLSEASSAELSKEVRGETIARSSHPCVL